MHERSVRSIPGPARAPAIAGITDPRVLALLALGVVAAAGLAIIASPMPQPRAYHAFANTRRALGVPNAWNVLSNIPFTIFGLIGFWTLLRGHAAPMPAAIRNAYLVLCLGVTLTGFGSAYYHWAPGNATLFWDRLPMAVAFMGLFTAVVGERLGIAWTERLLWPAVAFGIASVVYWHYFDDLRPYILTQFYPLVTIPLLIWLFAPSYTRGADFFVALGLYVVAKLLETYDAAVFQALGGVMCGHSLKHLAAAVGAWWVLRMLKLRQPVG